MSTTPAQQQKGEERQGLLQRLRDGDAGALDEVLQREWTGLVSYAQRLTDDNDLAEDLAQRAFVRLWQRREALDPAGSVRALLYRTTRNLAIDTLRTRRNRSRLLGILQRRRRHSETPEDQLGRRELSGAIDAAIAELTPRRREAFRLCRLNGLSQQEAAEVMGLSVQTVANHVSAALKHIRDALAPHLG